MNIKAFAAGAVFPTAVLPFVYAILFFFGHAGVHSAPLQFMPLFLPIIFGLWNVLYFKIGGRCPVKSRSSRMACHGALLGLMAALFGVFLFGIPELIFGITGGLRFLPLVFVPILYGLIWRFIVGPLNNLFGLEDQG